MNHQTKKKKSLLRYMEKVGLGKLKINKYLYYF